METTPINELKGMTLEELEIIYQTLWDEKDKVKAIIEYKRLG